MNGYSLTVLTAFTLVTSGLANAQSASSSATICVYDSRSYSEGAEVCIARHFLLSCLVDNGRAVWKRVSDPEASQLCVRAFDQATLRHVAVRRHLPTRSPQSARCFAFNGKTFCE